MDKTRIEVSRLPTTTLHQTVDINVSYDKGGSNPFQGTVEPRGYYVSATPVIHKDGIMTMAAFSGTKTLLEPAKRFNRKKLEEIAVKVGDRPELKKVINNVLTKNKITLVSTE